MDCYRTSFSSFISYHLSLPVHSSKNELKSESFMEGFPFKTNRTPSKDFPESLEEIKGKCLSKSTLSTTKCVKPLSHFKNVKKSRFLIEM